MQPSDHPEEPEDQPDPDDPDLTRPYLEPDDPDEVDPSSGVEVLAMGSGPTRHLVPVADFSTPAHLVPWEEVRRMYTQGIACGPSYPNRQHILDIVGAGDVLTKPRKPGWQGGGGHNKVTKVGPVSIVFPTKEGVATYFNVSVYQVKKRATEEDWATLKQIYRSQLHQRVTVYKQKRRLINVENVDAKALKISKLGMKMIIERLEMMDQTVEVMDGEVNPVRDYKELESLSKAATFLHQLGRRALGFPVDKVGIVGEAAGQDLSHTEFGLFYDDEAGDDRQLGIASNAAPDGIADSKPSVANELAKDDVERLAQFLSVLGRAQVASEGEEEDGAAGVG